MLLAFKNYIIIESYESWNFKMIIIICIIKKIREIISDLNLEWKIYREERILCYINI